MSEPDDHDDGDREGMPADDVEGEAAAHGDQVSSDGSDSSGPEIGIDTRVRIRPGSTREARGVVVEDYGEDVGYPVDIGEHRIVEAARRWAVVLDAGGLVFVDDGDLVPE